MKPHLLLPFVAALLIGSGISCLRPAANPAEALALLALLGAEFESGEAAIPVVYADIDNVYRVALLDPATGLSRREIAGPPAASNMSIVGISPPLDLLLLESSDGVQQTLSAYSLSDATLRWQLPLPAGVFYHLPSRPFEPVYHYSNDVIEIPHIPLIVDDTTNANYQLHSLNLLSGEITPAAEPQSLATDFYLHSFLYSASSRRLLIALTNYDYTSTLISYDYSPGRLSEHSRLTYTDGTIVVVNPVGYLGDRLLVMLDYTPRYQNLDATTLSPLGPAFTMEIALDMGTSLLGETIIALGNDSTIYRFSTDDGSYLSRQQTLLNYNTHLHLVTSDDEVFYMSLEHDECSMSAYSLVFNRYLWYGRPLPADCAPYLGP